MKTLTLERFAFGPNGTLARLRLADDSAPGMTVFDCFTVERPTPPWVPENAPGMAAIPVGRYPVRPGTFFNNTATKADDYPCLVVEPVPGREHIKIHVGNTARNSRGCPLVGDSVGTLGHLPAVFNSRRTLAALLRAFGDAPGVLVVTNARTVLT